MFSAIAKPVNINKEQVPNKQSYKHAIFIPQLAAYAFATLSSATLYSEHAEGHVKETSRCSHSQTEQ